MNSSQSVLKTYFLIFWLFSDINQLYSFIKYGASEVIRIVMNISGEVLDENISDMNNTIDICENECKNTILGF